MTYASELQAVISNLYSLLEADHIQQFGNEVFHEFDDCVTCAALATYKERYPWLHTRIAWV